MAPKQVARLRLDRFLASQLSGHSRARLQRLIRARFVRLNGQAARPRDLVHAGDEIELTEPPLEKIDNQPEHIPLEILFEDDDLIVISKPAGLVVHPGAAHREHTLVNALLHHCPALSGIGGKERPGIVHRLDKDTSGCLVVAKTELALRGLQAQFKSRAVEKRYRALVHGAPPDERELDTLFGRHPVHRKRFSSKVRQGRRAVTRFRVLARAPGAAWLEVELLTGRTHQIRAHLAEAGWPLFCDALYGRRESGPVAEVLRRQALHAFQLAFDHPMTGARIACEAPLPADLRAALSALGLSSPA